MIKFGVKKVKRPIIWNGGSSKYCVNIYKQVFLRLKKLKHSWAQIKSQPPLPSISFFARSCACLVGEKILGENFWKTFTTLIMSIKYILIIKLITLMDEKSRGESIKPN